MTGKFPGESDEYRAARDRLLDQEVELRREMEVVAEARRNLPLGGIVPEDYVFQGARADGVPGEVRFSELFAPDKDALIVYSFMFPRHSGDDRPGAKTGSTSQLPLDEQPCPSCTAILDQLDGAVEHVTQRLNLAIGAKPLSIACSRSRRSGGGSGSACCRRPTTSTTVTTSARLTTSGCR